MELTDFKLLTKTKTFKIISVMAILYWSGFILFMLWIYPDTSKTPGGVENVFRDIVWIFYWRWNLDLLIIGGFALVVGLESLILRKLMARFSKDGLFIYLSPAFTMGMSFIYMVAIDIGVTYFADTGFAGTWVSPETLWLGMTAQQLYHTFFFWYIPIIIMAGITNQVMIHTNSYLKMYKTWFVLMGVYSLNLGFLDPIVCQVLWNDWRIFGQWAMGGADAIWAEGWMGHYIIFACFWFFGSYLLNAMRSDLIDLKEREIK